VTAAINKYVKDEALQISLVASDLDGTLFDKNTTIIPSTLHLIERFINEKNGFFAIASGRNLADVLLVLDEIETNKTDNLFAITCNGAAVYDIANKKCIFSKTIDSPVVKEIIDLFNNMFANKQEKFLEVFAHYEESMIFNRQPLNSYVINREEQTNFYKKYSPQIIERY
jgi:hydroxymethylpyrimidine pyrophosphatase-like HAD family hydrolase